LSNSSLFLKRQFSARIICLILPRTITVNRCTCSALNAGADDRQPGMGRVSGPMTREAPWRSRAEGWGGLTAVEHVAAMSLQTDATVGGFLFGFEEEVQVGLGGGRGSSR